MVGAVVVVGVVTPPCVLVPVARGVLVPLGVGGVGGKFAVIVATLLVTVLLFCVFVTTT